MRPYRIVLMCTLAPCAGGCTSSSAPTLTSGSAPIETGSTADLPSSGQSPARDGDRRARHADGGLCAGRPRRARLLVRRQRSAQGHPRLPCRRRTALAGRPGRDRAARARRLLARSARRPRVPRRVRERCGGRARRHHGRQDRAGAGRADGAGRGGVGEGRCWMSGAGAEPAASRGAAATRPPRRRLRAAARAEQRLEVVGADQSFSEPEKRMPAAMSSRGDAQAPQSR